MCKIINEKNNGVDSVPKGLRSRVAVQDGSKLSSIVKVTERMNDRSQEGVHANR